MCNSMVFQQLIWVVGYTKIPYGLNFPTIRKDIQISKFAKVNFPNLAAVKFHWKDNRCSSFFEIGTGAESAYEDEIDDNYRSSLKQTNN